MSGTASGWTPVGPQGRQVGAVGFSVAFGSVCARVARGLAQVRKADGWFLQM